MVIRKLIFITLTQAIFVVNTVEGECRILQKRYFKYVRSRVEQFVKYTATKKLSEYCKENGPPALQHPVVHYEDCVNNLAVHQGTHSFIDQPAPSSGAGNSMRAIDLNQLPPNEDGYIDMNRIP